MASILSFKQKKIRRNQKQISAGKSCKTLKKMEKQISCSPFGDIENEVDILHLKKDSNKEKVFSIYFKEISFHILRRPVSSWSLKE